MDQALKEGAATALATLRKFQDRREQVVNRVAQERIAAHTEARILAARIGKFIDALDASTGPEDENVFRESFRVLSQAKDVATCIQDMLDDVDILEALS
jgi:hypothetical protein